MIANEFIRRAQNLAEAHGATLDLSRVDLDNDLDTFNFFRLHSTDPAQASVHLTNAATFGSWKNFFQSVVSEMHAVTSTTPVDGQTYYAWCLSMDDFRKIFPLLKQLGCNVTLRRATA